MRRLVRRAAVRLCKVPCDAAFAKRFCASTNAAVVSSEFAAIAERADFTRVLSSERTARLRTRRFSLVRMRFFCDLMFAMRE